VIIAHTLLARARLGGDIIAQRPERGDNGAESHKAFDSGPAEAALWAKELFPAASLCRTRESLGGSQPAELGRAMRQFVACSRAVLSCMLRLQPAGRATGTQAIRWDGGALKGWDIRRRA